MTDDIDTDPAADEIQTIKAKAEELAALADAWLLARESYRAHQAEQIEAREHRAATALLRGPRP
ncbi:hypothetical protein IA539_16215 [Gordonia sp. zg691]|uniref:hypothetical protein n=1 Tax=Gordonia jinghuaiqii TaxID=2758710 RepID=UPI0016625417|nr:hypothetical protein [Gordonia jinghuaiqii]MBD0862737.1 hypothetical protein [Gordonia jinghuaiqii]